MSERVDRKWYLLYPEDTFKKRWDVLMTAMILLTCVYTPMFICFHEDKPGIDSAEMVNLVVDFVFAIDIFVVFFSAFYSEDFLLVDDMKDIA